MKRCLLLLLILIFGFSSFVVLGQNEDYSNEPYLTQYYDAGEFVPELCPFYILPPEVEEETVQCGYLIVPENRRISDSRNIELAVMIIYSDKPNSGVIVNLEGGPGASSITSYEAWYTSAFRADYDIILIDQRGTGFSMPTLNCYEADYEDSEDPMSECAERLRDDGVDLAAYNSYENAHDIGDLLEALEIEDANLYGSSYGTRLALTILRERPERIRSVVIDAVFPPNVNGYDEQAILFYASWERLFEACAADVSCNEAYPELDAVFLETVAYLNDTPLEIEDPESGEIFEFTGDDLVNGIFQHMYDAAMIPYIPSLIYAAYEEDAEAYSYIGPEETEEGQEPGYADEYYAALDEALMDYLEFDDVNEMLDYFESLSEDEQIEIENAILGIIDEDSEGMFNSVECYEEVHFNSMEAFDELSTDVPSEIIGALALSVDSMFGDCAIWDIEVSDAIENEAVSTDIPVLIFSGAFDPVTPQEWGDVAAQSLDNSYHFVFPGVGHGAFDLDPCPTGIGLAFLENPMDEPDGSCIDDMQAVFNTDY